MRITVVAAVSIGFIGSSRSVAGAHPLGNFTSNHLTRLSIAPHQIGVHYLLDDAEIPTFSLLRSLDPSGRPSQAVLNAWAARYAIRIASQLTLSVNGTTSPLTVEASHVRLRPGAAGLSILYFTADYRAPRPVGPMRVFYEDGTLPGHIGWKDVVVSPRREPTDELRNYPNALLGSPRDRTVVDVTVASNGAVSVADAPGAPIFGIASTARMNDLSDVLARNLSNPLVLLGALLLALGLGALHALEPGHGKTLLAISLVGARATVPQAVMLATTLTFAHTFGVLIFGVVILTLARYVLPETLYPWTALGSGVFVALLGARALAREIERRGSHDHSHDHAHEHGHEHDHHHHDDGGFAQAVHTHTHLIPGTAPLSFRSAVIAASTGNLAPCPAALVVLLAAIATHRIGYGLVLIVVFSIGLALTLTAIGVAVVRSAAWLTRRPQFDRVAHVAPLVTAGVISVIGAWMIGEAIVAQGVSGSPAWFALLVAAVIVIYITARAYRRPLSARAPA